MMWDGYGAGMGWMMITSSVLGLALIGLVVWAIVRVTSPTQPPAPTTVTRQQTARDILDRRFAAGEIDAESYRAAVQDLAAGRG
jgi:putative membrane protein